MDYKEKYEQALERAKGLLEGMDEGDYFASNEDIKNIFPELKDEDEKIRKGLIEGLRAMKSNFRTISSIEIDDVIAWLEKQGEKKPTDKVKPKFKPGDWIIFNGLILHIDEVVNGYYRTTSRGDGIHNSYDWNIDNAARLWTIQDAEDGDVLLEEETGEPFIYNGNRATYFSGYFLGAYCGIYNGEFNPYGNTHHWGKNSYPATKEQRVLLFQKMKEAGYEWDADKKELKKIESKALDPNKVIEWLNDQGCLGWIEDIEVEKFVEQFKKDFGL